MAISWEIDLYFLRENRDPESDETLESTHYYGRPVYKRTVETDSYEQGASGTLALYYKDDDDEGMMKRSHSIRDPDLIAIDAHRVGTPDAPDEDEIASTAEEWDQDAQ